MVAEQHEPKDTLIFNRVAALSQANWWDHLRRCVATSHCRLHPPRVSLQRPAAVRDSWTHVVILSLQESSAKAFHSVELRFQSMLDHSNISVPELKKHKLQGTMLPRVPITSHLAKILDVWLMLSSTVISSGCNSGMSSWSPMWK